MAAAMNDALTMRKVLWRTKAPQLLLVRPNCLSSKPPPKPCGLVGFKCVSNQNQNNLVLVKRQVKKKKKTEIETRFSILKHPFTAIDDESCLVGPPFEDSTIHGHSHGIVCFSTNLNDLFLYNLATRQLRKLPPSILTFPHNFFQGVYSQTIGVGFGYDPKSKDFKVVKIIDFYAHTQDTSRPPRAEVYDLAKDGWREIKTPIPSNPAQLSCFDMSYQGCYYWWATGFQAREVILSFDFTKEVFGIISMPEDLSYPKTFTSLAVLNESIVMFNYPLRGNEKSFDVWKMLKDEHDDKVVSWTKLFTIGPLFGIRCPLAFVSSNELLMVDDEGQLILCNIFNTQHCKPLPIKGEPLSFQTTLFDKTALSVKGGHKLSY